MKADELILPQVSGYRIEAALAEGGMATVYLAVQESLSRYVALKVMSKPLTSDADFRRRFVNEGRFIAKLSHPHIVTVYDIGVSEGIHYLSMTYLPGGTLNERLRGRLPLDQALYIVRCLADALGYAHKHSIVHRDIKPGNVLFTDGGTPVLTDFGIAKMVGKQTRLTPTGAIFGSVGYMSPEQTQGKVVDSRSDLYSLGVLFWRMLTGHLPYDAENPFELALKHAQDPIPKLPAHLRRFQDLLEGLLAKRPEDRLASAEELIRVIDAIPYEEGHPVSPPAVDKTVVVEKTVVVNRRPPVAVRQKQEQSPNHDSGIPSIDADPPAASKRRLSLIVSMIAILPVAGIVGFLGYRHTIAPTFEAPQEPAKSLGQAAGLPQKVSPDSGTGSNIGAELSAATELSQESLSSISNQAEGRLSVQDLLREGEEQWKAGRLLEPPEDNAFNTYRQVLELEPEHAEATRKLLQIGRISAANRVLESVDRLLRRGQIDDARRMIERGLKINPEDERLLGLLRALDY